MILFLLSLLAGILTVLAPCTISLLPVIVGGSLEGTRSPRRALVVTLSLGVSVILFTLLLKVSTAFIMVPQSFWELFSGVIIMAIGFTMLFPALYDRLGFVARINRSSNKLLATGYMKQNVLGDIIVGAALGPVFSSCSPTYFLIIATVLPKSVFAGSLYLLAYTFGLCATLLLVAVAGQKLLDKFGVASDPSGWLKRGIGALFVIVGLAIALGLDARLELAFANSGILDITGIEKSILSNSSTTSPEGYVPKAPEITGAAGYLNTNGAPITIGAQKGKVVLIDFWDYSCINCQREIPYVEAWYRKYAADGLVVIGVHTPEFAFEKLQSNVAAAAKSLGITYPIVLDNDYATWNAFNNEYWPQVYLIDATGRIVYSHSGEGEYPVTEAAIQAALKSANASSTIPSGTVAPAVTEVDGSQLGSPETYFGAERNRYLANGIQGRVGNQTLTLPTALHFNALYLGGSWNFQGEYAEATTPGAAIEYQFDAKNVYMVATGNPSAVLDLYLDGAYVKTITIDADKLYTLFSLPEYGAHVLKIELKSGTLDAYTFTFG